MRLLRDIVGGIVGSVVAVAVILFFPLYLLYQGLVWLVVDRPAEKKRRAKEDEDWLKANPWFGKSEEELKALVEAEREQRERAQGT